MAGAQSWNAANVISNKFSCGTLTTAGYNERTTTFNQMNPVAEEAGSLYPQSNFFGQSTRDGADRFSTRIVKELNDISFEEDEDWEEIKNLKRMPKTILNEENLRENLSEETLRLNLENHYWLKQNVLDKVGRMAPNIQVLSLRRMKFITNPVFAQIFRYMFQIESIDLTDCTGLLPTACSLLVDNNKSLSHL